LQQLIKKDYLADQKQVDAEGGSDEDEGTVEAEFYQDADLNEIISRDDNEFELYQQMDA
jgi:hypothetical protein